MLLTFTLQALDKVSIAACLMLTISPRSSHSLSPASLLDIYEEERVPVSREMLCLTSNITAVPYRTSVRQAASGAAWWAWEGGATSVFDFIRPTRHVVLVFDTALEKEVAEYIRKLPQDAVWAVALVKQGERTFWPDLPRLSDVEGHARQAYGADEGVKVAVIRPDGVVGALMKNASGLDLYFSKFFAPA
ncbi:unnamed protein product [Peniophora sp. CBMAI 1063]|nr:unnamed protein product [Peniophora sp. CBMAI 1063]